MSDLDLSRINKEVKKESAPVKAKAMIVSNIKLELTKIQSKNKKIVSIAVISLFIFSTFFAVPLALALPLLTLSPTSGPSGTIVTITGSGFASGSYRVYFDIDGDERHDYGEPYRSLSVGVTGTFTATLTVPSVSSGLYYTRADVYSYSPPVIASAQFTVCTIWDKLLDIESEIPAVENGLNDILTLLDEIEAKTNTINWADVTALATAVADIENKLDVGGSFYTFLDGWFTTIQNAISTSISNITTAILDLKTQLEAKIDTAVMDITTAITNTKTDILSAISSAQIAIINDIESKLTAERLANIDLIDEIYTFLTTEANFLDESELNAVSDAIIGYIDTLEQNIGTPGPPPLNTVFSALTAIYSKVDTEIDTIKAYFEFGGRYYNTVQALSSKGAFGSINSEQEKVDLMKPAKVTLTVFATDDTNAGCAIVVFLSEDGINWWTQTVLVTGSGATKIAGTVEFTTPRYFYVNLYGVSAGDRYAYFAEYMPSI